MKETEIVIFDQNIWGNIARTQCVSNRNACVCELIEYYNADILAFQECNPATSRNGDVDISLLLADEYEEVKTSFGKRNCTPIFYKASRFSVIESGFHLFEGLNDVESKSLTYAIFSDIETDIRFGIISTHFWWKCDSDADNLQRIENAKVLLGYIDRIQKQYDIPVFAMGDLNCGIYSSQGTEPYLFIKKHLLDAREIAPISTDTLTHHDYPEKDKTSIYHVPKDPEPKRTLDHVFVTEHPHVAIDSFEVDSSDTAYISSDHFPLIVKARVFSE